MSGSEADIVRQLAALLGLSQGDDAGSKELRGSQGSTPSSVQEFLEAASNGDRRACQLFVKNGGRPNVRDNRGFTALHMAAHKGKLAVIKDLLKLGADIDSVDKDGDTPLNMAVFNRQKEAIELLIENGADVRHVNNKGLAAADIALMKRSMSMVLLLEGVAHCVHFDSKMHEKTLAYASQEGNTRIIEFWLNNHPNRQQASNHKFGQERTMAFIAALNGHLDVIQLLDRMKADFELPDDREHTPLFCAAQNDHYEIVEFLLKKRCNVNHESITERTPIFSAVVNGHDDIVQLLIDNGANVNHSDEDGTSPLECAIKRGSMPIFQMLIKAGANPKHVDDKGYDMAMYAADTRRLDMLKELKKLGVSMTRVNKRNLETALLGACQVGPREVVEFLLREGSAKDHKNRRGVSPILRAVYNELTDVVSLLADAGADLDAGDNDNDTPILVAAQQSNMQLVRFLHSRKCSLSAKNTNGITMAWFAAKNAHLELLQFLKDAGAPLDVPDSKGNTPLMMAVKEAQNPEIVGFLVSCGCRPRKENRKGETAEDMARKSDCKEILDALRNARVEPGARAARSMRGISLEMNRTMRDPTHEPTSTEVVLDSSFQKWDIVRDDKGSKMYIGKGAFGKVYKAKTDKQQFVAVKIVKTSGKHDNREKMVIAREKRGMEALKGIRHANIVEFLKCETTSDGRLCIFTEFIEGLSLADFMKRQEKPFDEDDIRKFSRQICSTLGFLHRRSPQILHRDIKGSNIMLTRQGVIKLIDFGLAKEIALTSMAGMSDAVGTLYFMAPELFDGSTNTGRVMYTSKSDVWAFGCTVFEMATGDPPNSHVVHLLLANAIINKPPPKLPESCSRKLRSFYQSCVTKDFEKRPEADDLMRHEFLANK